jgi:glycopeptide antibiotics resistance protein
VWFIGTVFVLCWFEIVWSFKGAQAFDYFDIIASFVGGMLAWTFYHSWRKRKLVFE